MCVCTYILLCKDMYMNIYIYKYNTSVTAAVFTKRFLFATILKITISYNSLITLS